MAQRFNALINFRGCQTAFYFINAVQSAFNNLVLHISKGENNAAFKKLNNAGGLSCQQQF